MKQFKNVWLPIVLSSLFLSHVSAFAGGGASSGDGYSREVIPYTEIRSLDSNDALRAMIANITREFPTLGFKLNTTLDRLNGQGYVVAKMEASNADQYAGWEGSSQMDSLGLPAEATVQLWTEFFALPLVDDEALRPSQAKVILHEMIHIAASEHQELKTIRLTETLYRLGRQGVLSSEDRAVLVRDLAHLSFGENTQPILRYLETIVPDAANVYCRAGFDDRVLRLGLGHNSYTFPVFNTRGIALQEQDRPLFHAFFIDCLKRTEEGQSLLSGFAGSPLLLAEALSESSGAPIRFEFSLNAPRSDSRSIIARVESWRALSSLVEDQRYRRRILINETGLRSRIPGFDPWFMIKEETRRHFAYQVREPRSADEIFNDILNSALKRTSNEGAITLTSGVHQLPNSPVQLDLDRVGFSCQQLTEDRYFHFPTLMNCQIDWERVFRIRHFRNDHVAVSAGLPNRGYYWFNRSHINFEE